MQVYGSGISEVTVVYRSGRTNTNADALLRNPYLPAPQEGIGESELQVAAVSSEPEVSISALLQANPGMSVSTPFGEEQKKDTRLREVIQFLKTEELPTDPKRAKKIASLFAIMDDVLYYIDHKRDHQRRVAVPKHLREKILGDVHHGKISGHFTGKRTFSALARHWWWEKMYVESCPECTITAGTGRHYKTPLHPIPVSKPFQIVGADLMELPKTRRGNKYVLVLQDYLTK